MIAAISDWAATKEEIEQVWLFGSRVLGSALSGRNLDIAYLAVEGSAVADPTTARTLEQAWEAELLPLCYPYSPRLHSYAAPNVKQAVDAHGECLYSRAMTPDQHPEP